MTKIIVAIALILMLVAAVGNLVVFLFSKNERLATRSKNRFIVLIIAYFLSSLALPKAISIICESVGKMEAQRTSQTMLIILVCTSVYCIVSILLDGRKENKGDK